MNWILFATSTAKVTGLFIHQNVAFVKSSMLEKAWDLLTFAWTVTVRVLHKQMPKGQIAISLYQAKMYITQTQNLELLITDKQ